MIIDPNRVEAFLKQKMRPDLACEVCGNNDWSYSNVLFEIDQLQSAQFQIGLGQKSPYLPVSCNNCGNTKFFNAINAGFLDNRGKKID